MAVFKTGQCLTKIVNMCVIVASTAVNPVHTKKGAEFKRRRTVLTGVDFLIRLL